jgi:CheY-like chemotaxis protein
MDIYSGYALIVDDEVHNREIAQKLLEKAGLKVLSAANGAEAISAIEANPGMSIAFIDFQMPDINGLELGRYLRSAYPDVPLVMATVNDDRPLIERAFSVGFGMFMIKPNGFIELYQHLRETELDENFFDKRWIVDVNGLRQYRGSRTKN